ASAPRSAARARRLAPDELATRRAGGSPSGCSNRTHRARAARSTSHVLRPGSEPPKRLRKSMRASSLRPPGEMVLAASRPIANTLRRPRMQGSIAHRCRRAPPLRGSERPLPLQLHGVRHLGWMLDQLEAAHKIDPLNDAAIAELCGSETRGTTAIWHLPE